LRTQLIRTLGVFLVWYLTISLVIGLYPSALALLVLAPFVVWFLERLVVRRGRPGARRRWAALRLRPLRGEALRWTLLGVPVLAALSWSLGEVYVRLVPVPSHVFNPFDFITGTASGRLLLTVFAVGFAPVVEEFIFRGMLQRPLERRLDVGRGIAVAAAVFAAIHFLPWVLPLHFVLGLVFGWAVYATRSIWAGVLLHAANNALAVLGLDAAAQQEPMPTVWQTGPTSELAIGVAVLLGAVALAYGVGRKMWHAGHAHRRGR
jgi:membrane protease YdiL (CAAX protease family)